jgi:hypothetical protein
MDECNIIADTEDITAAQECRRKFVDEGGKLSCDETAGCYTPPACASETSDDAKCFLSCDAKCALEITDETDENNECAQMCTSECGRLLEVGAKSDDENEADKAEDGDRSAEVDTFTESDVAQCVKLCSVASECLAKDQMYEFNAGALSQGPRVVLAGAGLASPVDDADWQFATSKERARILEALSDPDSSEAADYERYIHGLHALDRAGPGGGMDLPDGMSMSDLLSAMGMEGGEGLDEGDIMGMLEQMMGGMGGMMGGDEYGGMYGGDAFGMDEYGSGDMYASMMGGMGGMGGGSGDYEDAEEEADDFE